MKSTNIIRTNFIFLSLKRNILPFIFYIFTICLVIFSKENLSAAKSGLLLWANNVIPSLFPFFIATELLGYTNIIPKIGKLLNPIMKPIFNVPGCGAYALIMGIISGYPIGAKIVTNFRENNICSKEECERLLAFTNNSGPLFIIGTVGISLFYNSTIGILLFITHILACLTVGILFRFWKYNKNSSNYNKFIYSSNTKNVSFTNLGEILSKSISSAITTTLAIGGFVVLFSVILSILENTKIISSISILLKPFFSIFGVDNSQFISSILSGLVELTNGLNLISNISCKSISLNIIFSSFLLGFGGISILLQVFSIISKTDLSIKPYIIGKIFQGIFASFYTYIFINYFPIFNFNF